MIYGRFGDEVKIVRRGTLKDVQALDHRKPDNQDHEAIKHGSYVVVIADGVERLYHQAFLRADGGSLEIQKALSEVER